MLDESGFAGAFVDLEQLPPRDARTRSASAPFSPARHRRAVLGPQFLVGRTVALYPRRPGGHPRGMIFARNPDPQLANERFDLVHCNHFFCMPVALRLAKGARILLDSHDLQARQFTIMNDGKAAAAPAGHLRADARARTRLMQKGRRVAAPNAEENEAFTKLFPEKRNVLLYPPVPAVPTGPGGDEIVLVSSRNRANVESALWFLRGGRARSRHCRSHLRLGRRRRARRRSWRLYEKYRGWLRPRRPHRHDLRRRAAGAAADDERYRPF